MGILPVFLATPICMENLPKHCHKSGMIPKDTTDGTHMMFREIGDGNVPLQCSESGKSKTEGCTFQIHRAPIGTIDVGLQSVKVAGRRSRKINPEKDDFKPKQNLHKSCNQQCAQLSIVI